MIERYYGPKQFPRDVFERNTSESCTKIYPLTRVVGRKDINLTDEKHVPRPEATRIFAVTLSSSRRITRDKTLPNLFQPAGVNYQQFRSNAFLSHKSC